MFGQKVRTKGTRSNRARGLVTSVVMNVEGGGDVGESFGSPAAHAIEHASQSARVVWESIQARIDRERWK
jgi:hypothetical protein